MKLFTNVTDNFLREAINNSGRAAKIARLEKRQPYLFFAVIVSFAAALALLKKSHNDAGLFVGPIIMLVALADNENSLRLLKIVDALKRDNATEQ